MEILFAGLIALGVAVAIVFLLKFLCFMGEFLSAQRKQLQSYDYSQETSHATGLPNTIAPAAISNGSDPNRQLGAIRRLSERLYVFCNEPVVPKSNQNSDQKRLEFTEPDIESPPSYEEAMRFINQQGSTPYYCEPPSDVLSR